MLSNATAVAHMFSSTSAVALHLPNTTIPEGCMVLDPSPEGFIPWNNPDNIISQETEKAADAVIGAICLPILFVISVPCNFLNMLVFWRQGITERINLCLFCLSLVDLLHILNSMLAGFDRILTPFTQSIGPVLKFVINHSLIGFRGFYWLSGFISMVIACERCLCVASPLRSQTLLKLQTMAAVLALGTVMVMTGSMVNGLRWSLACVFSLATNTTSSAIYTSRFYARNKTQLNILTFFVATVQPFTYVTVVLATTIVTSVKLRKMMSWREQTSSCTLSSREVALTRTLIALSMFYVVCSVPTIVTGVGVIFVPGYGLSGRYYNLANLLVNLAKLASYVNATFNFFVYCFMGSRFKKTLFHIFRCQVLMPVPIPK